MQRSLSLLWLGSTQLRVKPGLHRCVPANRFTLSLHLDIMGETCLTTKPVSSHITVITETSVTEKQLLTD
jgi:hypothetical protein